MKKVWSVLGVIVAMLVSTFLLTKLFLYYADRPLKIKTISKVEKVKETEEVLQFIHTTHESFNSFLNYGKSESYTEGDWKALHKWFTENEKALQNISNQVNSPKLKLDVASSYELAKLGVQAGNIQYVVYGVGDVHIDFTMAMIPEGETVIIIHGLIGNVRLYVPYDIEVSVNHSVLVGNISMLGHEEKGFNKNVILRTEQYGDSSRRIKIISSLLIGDMEVRYA